MDFLGVQSVLVQVMALGRDSNKLLPEPTIDAWLHHNGQYVSNVLMIFFFKEILYQRSIEMPVLFEWWLWTEQTTNGEFWLF